MVGGAVLLIVAGVMLVPRSKEAQPSSDSSRTIQATPQVTKSHEHDSVAQPKADAEAVAKDAKLPDEERAAILNEIEQASVTYDAKALPSIERYLLHSDPEVRVAAMNGMIVLGDAAAGPLLRQAAEKAPSPKEAVAMAEAADYVELPSGTFVPKDRTAAGTRKPLEGKPGERSRPRLTPSAKPKEDSSLPAE